MKVITLAAHKGGVGKTTMTASLAVLAQQELDEEGGTSSQNKIAMMDLDPQGSLTTWYNHRKATGPVLLEPLLSSLHARLLWLKSCGYRYLFIDTPPGYSGFIDKAMHVADLVVVPVRPGHVDMEAVQRTLEARIYKRGLFTALPNAGQYRSRSMGELIQRLDGEGHYRLPPIHNRVDVPLRDGWTIMEAKPTSAGAQELRQVWGKIRQMLGE